MMGLLQGVCQGRDEYSSGSGVRCDFQGRYSKQCCSWPRLAEKAAPSGTESEAVSAFFLSFLLHFKIIENVAFHNRLSKLSQ